MAIAAFIKLDDSKPMSKLEKETAKKKKKKKKKKLPPPKKNENKRLTIDKKFV